MGWGGSCRGGGGVGHVGVRVGWAMKGRLGHEGVYKQGKVS